MSGTWKEVAVLRFKGERFRDHALHLNALAELVHFQKMVAETTKELWRAAHPDRKRLPGRFDQAIRLYLREIEGGSVNATVERYVEKPDQAELWEEEETEIEKAIALTREVFEAGEKDVPLPKGVTKDLLEEYVKWGQGLVEDEEMELVLPDKKSARIDSKVRERLKLFLGGAYEDNVEVIGEVLEADVKRNHFELWLDDRNSVIVQFLQEREEEVTTALKDHRKVQMQVKGKGERSREGKPLKILHIEELRIRPIGEVPFDPTAPSIGQILDELGAAVPKEEWDKLPVDLTDNLDHYLYGAPKRR